jgi:general secretion pathway protein A
MYEKYYGFSSKPFEITPDPKFFFQSENHKEALAHLKYAIKEGKGFSVITGEVGTGKTTLVHMILSAMDEKVRIANIFNPLMEPDDFLDYVCVDLGIREAGGGTRGQNITLLYHFLLECFEKKERVFLIIDEAQNLDKRLLEEVRLLTNLETSKNKLLHVILLGQPELNKTLSDEKFRALKQRITTRYNLNALTQAETKEYILFRLKKAGTRNLALFDDGAVNAIYRYSKGIPRIINIVCDNALIAGFSQDLTRIKKPLLLDTIRDLEGLQKTSRNKILPAVFIALIVLICAILAAFGIFPDFFVNLMK